jgi:hypothetical protein
LYANHNLKVPMNQELRGISFPTFVTTLDFPPVVATVSGIHQPSTLARDAYQDASGILAPSSPATASSEE